MISKGTKRSGLTAVELVVVFIMIALIAITVLPHFARRNQVCRPASCQSHLKQMAIVFKLYASEDISGRFPPAYYWSEKGETKKQPFSISAVSPRYRDDWKILACP
ncbi:Tfp pilus assembly protein FimT/FimU [Candidatus Hydrogenedentota bacterium]